MLVRLFQIAVLLFAFNLSLAGQDHGNHDGHDHGDHSGHAHAKETKAVSHDNHATADTHDAGHGDGHHEKFDPSNTAIHHISDANVLTILEQTIPLPCFLYNKEEGWKIMSSGQFEPGHHENGHKAVDRYVLFQGSVFRVTDASFPKGVQEVGAFSVAPKEVMVGGKPKMKDQAFVEFHGKKYEIDRRSTWDGGFLGGGVTSFYDFSITKNVFALLFVSFFLFWAFFKAAKFYKSGQHLKMAPKGITAFLETMFLFIRDEVAIPFIGEAKYMKFIPVLMSLFFFIVGLNLFGQIPFFGGINASGNLTITLVLALVVFFVVNLNGKKDYWGHIFWMPGVPSIVRLILTPVEVMGLIIKPLTLMLRLAGNISAGHIAILSFIGLIFIFGDSGASLAGSLTGTAISVPLTLFMMALELLVAFVQAFVFTILAASYIGSAIEEHH